MSTRWLRRPALREEHATLVNIAQNALSAKACGFQPTWPITGLYGQAA